MRTFIALAIFVLASTLSVAQEHDGILKKQFTAVWSADNGDGTFTNPIINADGPDIDIIRVEDTYYMVTTTMYVFPGATIFKSKDLVNWEYCCNPLKQIDNNDAYNLQKGFNHYGQGQWASSLKYHDGKFYLYFIAYGGKGDNDPGRNVLLTAKDPEGEWTMTYMNEHYYDAGWMFDDGENGDGYLYVACGIGDIWVNKLNAKTLQKITSTKVFSKEAHEGSHMYHIGEWYYIYLTNGGYWRGQTILRSKSPMGPYVECPNGNQQAGSVFSGQGIHQGGFVQTQTGEWWTIMFKDAGSIGRIPYLEPVVWEDGWPVIGKNGIDVSKNSGKYPKPNIGVDADGKKIEYPKTYLPTNDPFSQLTLGKQWGWNHNPLRPAWSLSARPGWLRLKTSTKATDLTQARNTLTQRILGYSPEGTAKSSVKSSFGTIKMDVSNMSEGDICGLAVFQENYGYVGVKMENGVKKVVLLITNFDGDIIAQKTGKEVPEDGIVYLRAECNFGTDLVRYSYCFDNYTFRPFSETQKMNYTLRVFTGNRFAIFNYATAKTGGYVDVDWFTTEKAPFYEEDFYTDEYLYPNGKPDAIESHAAPSGRTEYYSVSGTKLKEAQKGVNIVKFPDGSTKKIIY